MNILIAGDSWGCGEWGCTTKGCGGNLLTDCQNNCQSFSDIKNGIRHPGLEQYLRNANYNVKNVSIPGSSLKNAIKQILKNYVNYDLIILFQTEPIRDVELTYCDFNSFDEVNEFNKEILTKHYRTLQSLDKEILLIGGHVKINPELYDLKLSNINVFVSSMTEEFANIPHPDLMISGSFFSKNKEKISKLSYEYKSFLLDESDKCRNFDNCPKYFAPDMGHINRFGHLALFNKLKESKII